jgi:3-deoxy-D-manno-octulosonate 8-phosphate phosphatase (KDO 8-P phosphatase)
MPERSRIRQARVLDARKAAPHGSNHKATPIRSAAPIGSTHKTAPFLGARKATPFGKIELLVLDVDGVLTDGRLYFSAGGEALKVFHVRDGHGIKLLLGSGVEVAAVSGRRSAAVTKRMRELGVRHVVQGCADKVAALLELARRLDIPALACACIVDDTPDLPLMSAVGLAAAVADAHPVVLSAAHWISTACGGRGPVRELCDAILRARAEQRGVGTSGARTRRRSAASHRSTGQS